MSMSKNENENDSSSLDDIFPAEIMSHCFNFLEPSELRNCRLVSRNFSNVISNINRHSLGPVEFNRDWRIFDFLVSTQSKKISTEFTNFIFPLNNLSSERIEEFSNGYGASVRKLKLVLISTLNPEEDGVKKLEIILNRAQNLRTLEIYFHHLEKIEILFNRGKLFLPQQLNLDPNLVLKLLTVLSFKGKILRKADFGNVESFISIAPNLKKLKLVIEGAAILSEEFNKIVPYLKKPMLSLTIIKASMTEVNILSVLIDSELKLEKFAIHGLWDVGADDANLFLNNYFLNFVFSVRIRTLLELNSSTLKNFKLAKDFLLSSVYYPFLPALRSFTLSIDEGFEKEHTLEERNMLFFQKACKIKLYKRSYELFLNNTTIILPLVQELIVNNLYAIRPEKNDQNPENLDNQSYVDWSLIFPNLQTIRLRNSTFVAEKYVVEHLSGNLKELEIRGHVYGQSSLWNIFVGENVMKIDCVKLLEIIRRNNPEENDNFQTFFPDNFEPRVNNLKKLQKLKLSTDEKLDRAEEYVETLVFLSASKWLQPLDLLYINLPSSYKNVHPPSFLQFLNEYHRNFKISFEKYEKESWPGLDYIFLDP